jgi:uncharacterized membrane protein YwaF
MLYFNLTGVFVLAVDLLLKSNYMFLLQKPEAASLMNLLGPWPVYYFTCNIIAFIFFILLYLPFLFNKKKSL